MRVSCRLGLSNIAPKFCTSFRYHVTHLTTTLADLFSCFGHQELGCETQEKVGEEGDKAVDNAAAGTGCQLDVGSSSRMAEVEVEDEGQQAETKTETQARKTETEAQKEKPHDIQLQQHEYLSADGCKPVASFSRSSSSPSTHLLRPPMPLSILSVPLVVEEHKELPCIIRHGAQTASLQQVRESVR